MKVKRPSFKHFFALFLLLNFIDALTTHSILSLGGVELNFLPALIIENYGMNYFFIFKIFVPAILGLVCVKMKDVWDFLIGLFSLICLWNTLVLMTISYGLLMLC